VQLLKEMDATKSDNVATFVACHYLALLDKHQSVAYLYGLILK